MGNQTHSITSIIIFLSLVLVQNHLTAQNKEKELTKRILYLSYITDEVSLNTYTFDYIFNKMVANADSFYNDFQYESTEPLHLHFTNREEIYTDKYTVQLFKIHQLFQSYYILSFNSSSSLRNSFSGTLWIRVAGYIENDLKVFLDSLREKGMSMEEIRSMIELWCQKDSLFDELDWNCLVDGYEQNNTNADCYISSVLIRHDAACVNCKYEVYEDDIHSRFSRIILLGALDF